MMSSSPLGRGARKTKRLVLVGAGHAHIEVLKRFAMNPLPPECEVVVVNPSSAALYSGMLPGLVARQYQEHELLLNTAALASAAQAEFLRDEVVSINASAGKIVLRERPALDFDFLSLDIGSQTALPTLGEGVGECFRFLATRPFSRFLAQLAVWDRAILQERNEKTRLAVLGSGSAGIELAACFRQRYPQADITLLCGNQNLPESIAAALGNLRVKIKTPGTIARIETTKSGAFSLQGKISTEETDFLVCASGAKAWPIIATSGLPEHSGFLKVNEFLQCEGHENIFGAGDCIEFTAKPLAKAGVYAVRQGPLLAANLRAAVSPGSSRKKYRPQPRFLKLLNLGHGSAIAEYSGVRVSGAWAWRWKDRIDRRFLAMYSMEQPPMPEPDCGGCGSKAAADIVCALRDSGGTESAQVIWGTQKAEDIALWKTPASEAVAITVDQFRNFGADPYLFGRIAAISAASDLYAKGLAPAAALMTLTLPKFSSRLGRSWAEQLSAGVRSVFADEKIDLLGGHTSEGEEWNLGFTLWAAATQPLWEKRGLQDGDALLLTKPLGTGILLAAAMQGATAGSALDTCLATMAQSQKLAYLALRGLPVHAATDVTGFSLLGHLSEMLESGELSAELDLAQIPLLPEARKKFHAGYRSRMQEMNRQTFPLANLPAAADILYDPQTSGGLLVSIKPEAAPAALAALHAQGLVQATLIGRIGRRASGEKICVRA